MPNMQSLTVDEMLVLLKKMKKEYGGHERVYINNPYDDGIGWECLPISDIHYGNSAVCVQVPVKKKMIGEN